MQPDSYERKPTQEAELLVSQDQIDVGAEREREDRRQREDLKHRDRSWVLAVINPRKNPLRQDHSGSNKRYEERKSSLLLCEDRIKRLWASAVLNEGQENYVYSVQRKT